jgi:hypothetical protein
MKRNPHMKTFTRNDEVGWISTMHGLGYDEAKIEEKRFKNKR